LSPDPDHPGLVRIHAWAIREYTYVADDANYQWKIVRERTTGAGRRPSDEFFSRGSSSTTEFYLVPATLANYFKFDFGNGTQADALEVVPSKPRFEFGRRGPVVIPLRVVFHFDEEAALAAWRESKGEPALVKLPQPAIKFADQPDGTEFWGLRIETPDTQI